MFMMRYMSIFDRDKNSVFLARANPAAKEDKKHMALAQMDSQLHRAQTQAGVVPGGDWTRLASEFTGVEEGASEDNWEEDSDPHY